MVNPVPIAPKLAGRPQPGDSVQTPIGRGMVDRFEHGIAVVIVNEGGMCIEHRLDTRKIVLNRAPYHEAQA